MYIKTQRNCAKQVDSALKNRWCGAFWQKQKMTVIPAISWSSNSSLEFCFDAIEKGSVVAVSTYKKKIIKMI